MTESELLTSSDAGLELELRLAPSPLRIPSP